MKRMIVGLSVSGIALLALAGAGHAQMQKRGYGGMGGQGMGMMQGMNAATVARRRAVRRGDIPEAYRTARNPLDDNQKILALGKTVYNENCAACHGAQGRGDGEAGRDLNPKPVDLTRMRYRRFDSDRLIFYAVSEGGARFGSDMPGFKDSLGEKERWAVVRYVQRGLGR